MKDQFDQEISAHEAARLIYNAPRPSPEQVGQVRLHLLQGRLKPKPGHPAATTTKAVAEFLAAVARGQQCTAAAGQQFRGFYAQLMRDYFLSVVTRRRMSNRSGAFQRAVLAGQVVVLIIAGWAIFSVVRGTVVLEPPEHKLVKAWIDKQHGPTTVEEWSPTQPSEELGGKIVRVRFNYRSGKKQIHAERTLLVIGDQVRLLTEDDSH